MFSINSKSWLNLEQGPFVISGPCSAETEEQMMATAKQLADTKRVHAFRAGMWKPRTRPNGFEGVGSAGLKWLKQIKSEYGLLTATEVATEKHVYEALKYGVDILWVGARSTTSPFAVQEIAEALQGVDVIVLIKNPMNPDLDLWAGALERIAKVGITKLGFIHRGFSTYEKIQYRNLPMWPVALELRRRFPQIPIFCDPSHMGGDTHLLHEISQKSLDLNYDGLLIESHVNPGEALTDAKQQITPGELHELLTRLIVRSSAKHEQNNLDILGELRSQIDVYDTHLLEILEKRMIAADKIGQYKKDNGIVIFQSNRWDQIVNKVIKMGEHKGLSREFIEKVFQAIHEESINHQVKVMNNSKAA